MGVHHQPQPDFLIGPDGAIHHAPACEQPLQEGPPQSPSRPSKEYLLAMFENIHTPKEMYEVGYLFLGFEADAIPPSLRTFQAAYELWLTLGNGFGTAVSTDSPLTYLLGGVAAFRVIGADFAAAAGQEVIDVLRRAGTTESGDETLLEETIDEMYRQIEAIDARYMSDIWNDAHESIEGCLLSFLPTVIQDIRQMPKQCVDE